MRPERFQQQMSGTQVGRARVWFSHLCISHIKSFVYYSSNNQKYNREQWAWHQLQLRNHTWIVNTLGRIPRTNKRVGPCAEKPLILQLQMRWKHQKCCCIFLICFQTETKWVLSLLNVNIHLHSWLPSPLTNFKERKKKNSAAKLPFLW